MTHEFHGCNACWRPKESTPQADSESFERRLQAVAADRDFWREQAQKLDSVLEDVLYQIKAIEYTPLGVRAITAMNQLRVAIAARKQGANHDT